MNIKNDLFEFELEFCLTKNAYMEAYDEDDTLWNLNHNKMMELFHKIFIYNEGQCHIIEDIFSMTIFFKSIEAFIGGFDRNEFSKEEYEFLNYFITKSYSKMSLQ